MAESSAFLLLLMYTQAQNAGKYLILALLSRRFSTDDTPVPARQSAQTRPYQRVTRVQSAPAQGIALSLSEGAHKHLWESQLLPPLLFIPHLSPLQKASDQTQPTLQTHC